MTLQRFLARLTWLSLAPVVLAAVLLAGLDLLGHQRDADFVAEGRAKALAAALDAELRARIQGLGLLAQSPALDDPNDRAALRQTLRTWRELYDSQAMLTDDAGQVLAHAAPAPGGSAPELPEVIDESLRRAVIESGIPALSGVYRERVTHEDKVAVLVPLLRTGKPALLLIATVDTRTLREAVPAASLPQGWSARLLDRDGRAVGTVGAAGAPAGTTPRAWAPLPAAGWRLELWAPAVAAKPVVAREAGIFALGLVLALLVAWWVARRASQRLLRQLAGLLQTGPAADHPPDPAPIAEILALRRQLDEAAQTRESAQAGRRTTEQNYRASLESANRALRLSEGRLKAIVESAGDAILILDATGTVVIANPAAARLHGCEVTQLVGSPMTRWLPQRLQDVFTQALASLDGQTFDVRRSQPGDRLAVLQAGGGEVPVVATLSVVQVDGEALHSLILRDIREERRAQRAADASLARLEAVVVGLDDAVRIVDAEGRIVDLNDTFAREHGFASRAACRDALAEHPDILAFAGADGQRLHDDDTPLARGLRGEPTDELVLTVSRRDTGASRSMRLRVFPLHDRSGRPLGAVEIGRRPVSPA